MPALGGSVQVADPGELKLKVLVLVVIVCDVDDARGLLDTILQRQLALDKVELLEFGLGDLSSLASSGTVVTLYCALAWCSIENGIQRTQYRPLGSIMYREGPPCFAPSFLPPEPAFGPEPTCPSTGSSASESQPAMMAVIPKGRTLE